MAAAIISGCVNYVQGYGFKFKNETSTKVNFRVHNTNWFSGDSTGVVNPTDTEQVGTGADCVDKVTVEATYPSDKHTKGSGRTVKTSKGFGHHCTSRSFVVKESCRYKDGDPSKPRDCEIMIDEE